MSYIVKYVGYCAAKNIDITPLYREDIANGDKVVLVCEKRLCDRYKELNLDVAEDMARIRRSQGNPVLMSCDESATVVCVQIAARLMCTECTVYIENSGFFTADPRQADFAKKMDRIDYDEALEICSAGYNAVNSAMVETAKKLGVAIRLKSYIEPSSEGTVIREVLNMGGAQIKGVIKEPDICIITLTDIPDVMGITYRIFSAVSDAGVVVDIISLPVSFNGRRDISFTVKKDDKRRVSSVLLEKQRRLGFTELIVDDNVAKISVVGASLHSSHGVAAAVFKIMYENSINLRLINTSEIKISLVVDKAMADLAVHKIHEFFID